MRVNLSVAIVYMVNNTAISGNGYRSREGEADNDKDGPFVWDEAQQGVILGMFFYGYVVTQVRNLHSTLSYKQQPVRCLEEEWQRLSEENGFLAWVILSPSYKIS